MGALCCCCSASDGEPSTVRAFDNTSLRQCEPAVNHFQSPSAPTEDLWMISCVSCKTKLMKQYPTTTCVHCGKQMVTDELPAATSQ